MNDVHINILINNCKITDTINSLHDQSFQNITVFLINNQIKNIHKFIDSRFVLADKSQNIMMVIQLLLTMVIYSVKNHWKTLHE